MDMLRDLIARQPRSHCAYFTMGVAFADAGLYRDAIRMWKKVVELAPTSAEAQSAKESIDVLERFLSGQQSPAGREPARSRDHAGHPLPRSQRIDAGPPRGRRGHAAGPARPRGERFERPPRGPARPRRPRARARAGGGAG